MTRRCNECSLCCKLLPMKAGPKPHLQDTIDKMIQAQITTAAAVHGMMQDFDKPAGQRCPHQRRSSGGCCSVYSKRPFGCRFWSCEWRLGGKGTEHLSRPDRSHYVIDCSPDFVTDTDSGAHIPVVQVWVDPRWPNAHRSPALRRYLNERGKSGYAALIRWSSDTGFVLFPPTMTGADWIEKEPSGAVAPEHTVEQRVAAIGEYTVAIDG